MHETIEIMTQNRPSFSGMWERLKFIAKSKTGFTGFRFDICTGVHSGLLGIFGHSPIAIGSAPDIDLMLLGDGLQSTHARLTPLGRFSSNIRLDAVDGEVELDDGKIVSPGEYTLLRGATSLQMGKTKLHVGPILDVSRITPALIFVISAAVLSFITVSVFVESGQNAFASISGLTTSNKLVEAKQVKIRSTLVDSRQAIGEANSWLRKYGIGHLVKLSRLDDRSVKVDGILPRKNGGTWTAFLRWYDTKTGFPTLINMVDVSGDQDGIPTVSAVWLGAKPFVEFDDGSRGKIGSVLKGGWKIVNISRAGISFERNGAVVKVGLT